MRTMSANTESEVQRGRYLGGQKGLLKVMSLEVLAESVGTVAEWRQRVLNFRCKTEGMSVQCKS